eukprot:9067286-Heterocapsa_arctica.AAC.1
MAWWSDAYGPYQWQNAGWPNASWQPQQGAGWHSQRPEQQQWLPAPERQQRGAPAPGPGDGSRTRRRALVNNFLKSRQTMMLN